MTVTVRLFAYYAEKLGATELTLDLADGSTVADALRVVGSLPGGSHLPPSPLVAINLSYARPASTLNRGDELAIIPPVAGG